MTNKYQFDPAQRIWAKPGTSTLTYSDGDESEEYLFSVITKAKDVSTNSPELASAIKDWPSEYHLSPVRHNLLRPFTLGPSDNILELGCGCGAMTRYLGETGAKVVAVEGSRRRAMIAAERCRDLPNVSIYCDNLIAFQAEGAFDYVTLIGVLEYSKRFIAGPDPVHACLEKAGNFLAQDGALVVAIENQLGLKYFNGYAEDHIGVPYYGICDLYKDDDPTTYGRQILVNKLCRAGFPHQTFFFPFPDYKLPQALVSESALHHSQFNVADLLCRMTPQIRQGQPAPAFHDNLAWQALARNGLLGDLANSFLVVASAAPQQSPSWLARSYTPGRVAGYAAETIFEATATSIQVVKRALYPQESSIDRAKIGFGALNLDLPQTETYSSGNLYIVGLQQLLARGEGITELAIWASPWARLLLDDAQIQDGQHYLDGALMDAIPANFVYGPDNRLITIDREWRISGRIPFAWVLIRGLINSIAVSPTSPALAAMSYQQVIEQTVRQLGFLPGLADQDFAEADRLESALRQHVYAEQHVAGFFAPLYTSPARCLIRPNTVQDELDRLQAEINRIKSTVSWWITKPLRLLANLPNLVETQFSSRRYRGRGR